MAYTSTMFSHRGSVSSDSLEERAFMAFSISMTTRMESDMVEAARALLLLKISQPISGNLEEHWWKCDWEARVFSMRGLLREEGKVGGGSAHELPEGDLRSFGVVHEIPRVSEYRRSANVDTDDHVAEE